MILARFRDGGLRIATVQAREITYGQASTLLVLNLALGVGLGLVVMLLGPALGWLYDEPAAVWVMLILGFSYVIGSGGVQFLGVMHRRMHYGRLAGVDVAALALSVAAGVSAALAGAGVYALPLAHLSLNLATTVLAVVCSGWWPTRPVPLGEVRPMFKFGFSMAASGAVNQLGATSDRTLLGLISREATGLYLSLIHI